MKRASKSKSSQKKLAEHFGPENSMGGAGHGCMSHGGINCHSQSALIGLAIKVLAAHTEILVSLSEQVACVNEKLDKVLCMQEHARAHHHHEHGEDHCDDEQCDEIPYEVKRKMFLAAKQRQMPMDGGITPVPDNVVVAVAAPVEENIKVRKKKASMSATPGPSSAEKVQQLKTDFGGLLREAEAPITY